MGQPLSDVRVLDLGQIYQGPYCGMILAYMGADVVKVEPPGGETVRDRSESDETPEVQFLNPNKSGIELNLKSDEGKAILHDLVAEADVLVENFSTGTMDDLGVGYESLRETNPSLIYAHGSGYGDYGPYESYPAMDLTIQARAGVMHTTGYPDRPPVKAGPAVSDFLGGIHLAAGVLGALYRRERTGEGEYVEVGMMDCVYPTLASSIARWANQIDAPPRTGNSHSGMGIVPYNVYETRDGYFAIMCIAERHWERLMELMDREDLLADERFASKARRAKHADEIDRMVADWVHDQPRDELEATLLGKGIPCAPVQSLEEIITDPHLTARGMLNYLPNEGEGEDELPVPGMPIKFRSTESPAVRPSPGVGEHTDDVLRELVGYSREEIEALRDRDAI